MDITYIPMNNGYLYLVAIIDLYRRFVLGWSLSNTMRSAWCKQTLEEAIENHGVPQILDTNQGKQFKGLDFTSCAIQKHGISLSMDGKGRAIDKVFIERLWRSVKYEHVYLFAASDGQACYQGLKVYFEYYNQKRRHQSLGSETPSKIYQQSRKDAT